MESIQKRLNWCNHCTSILGALVVIKFLSKTAITAFILANVNIFIRLTILVLSFVFLNIFYTKWENLLLETNPDILFYLLCIYSLIILVLIIWFFSSLSLFSSFSRSKKTLEVKKSIAERSDQYSKIKDVRLYPKLKSSTVRSLEDH